MPKPLPVGTKVRYHGSLEEYHGEELYVVEHHTPYHSSALYPDGVAYVLAEDLTDWRRPLRNVRRTSFTVIPSEGEA